MDKKKNFKALRDSHEWRRQQQAQAAQEQLWLRQQRDLQSASIDLLRQSALRSSSMSQPGSNRVPEAFSNYFRDLFSEAHGIMVTRQASYGPGNVENQGPVGVFSRMAMDKVGRIANALNGKIEKGQLVVDEDWYNDEVHDALIDTINYAAILIALGQKKWSKVSREEDNVPT